MKRLEKKVHFVSEGTSIVGCYDSKGNPVRYILIKGEPYIELDKSVDRLLDIDNAAVHNAEVQYYSDNRHDMFVYVKLTGVINSIFISSKNSLYRYAERPCTRRELASFYLAMYKTIKNAIKLTETK